MFWSQTRTRDFFMQQKTTLTDAYDLFMLDCQARRLTPATLRFYEGKLSVFFQWLGERGITHIDDITANLLRQFLASIAERGLTDTYQHDLGRAIRAWLNYCVRDELLTKSPFAKVRLPKLSQRALPSFTDHEIQAILAACKTRRDEAICLFLLDTGVRASELIALNVADIDMKSGAVSVRLGKGKKDRTVHTGAKTRKSLVRYMATRSRPPGHEPLFISQTNERLTLSGLVQLFDRLRSATGIAHLSAHTFRRTFAISCLRNGMNIHVLAKIMGHADIQMLRRYLDITEDDTKKAHDEHGPVDNL